MQTAESAKGAGHARRRYHRLADDAGGLPESAGAAGLSVVVDSRSPHGQAREVRTGHGGMIVKRRVAARPWPIFLGHGRL